MYRSIIVSFFLGILCATAGDGNRDELPNKGPKQALEEELIRTRDLQLKAQALYKEAMTIGHGDLEETIAKLVMAKKLTSLLGTEDSFNAKLIQKVDRAYDDAMLGYYWVPGLKKDGVAKLVDYQGEWLKTDDQNPWILVKHVSTPPKQLRELRGFLIKDGRCLGGLTFVRVLKDFTVARLTPHWSALYYQNSSKGFREKDMKGASVYALSERNERVLMEISRGRLTVQQVLAKRHPIPKPPPAFKPLQALTFDGTVLTGKAFRATDLSVNGLRKALDKYGSMLAEPLTLTVAWKVKPATVDKLMKTLARVSGIKECAIVRGKRVNEAAKKLKELTLSKVNLQDTRITTALEFLMNQARNMDPAGEGVNFLYLPADGETGMTEPTVTMDVTSVTLEAVVKDMCQANGLKYRVEPFAVIVGKSLPKAIDLPQDYQRKYSEMVLSKVCFMDCRIAIIFEFLRQRAVKLDPYAVGLPLAVTLPKADAEGNRPDNNFAGAQGGETAISLDLDYMPILDVLRCVCYAAKLNMTFENGVVVINPLKSK